MITDEALFTEANQMPHRSHVHTDEKFCGFICLFPSLYSVQCFTVGKKWPHPQFPILGGQKTHTIKYKFWDHKNQCPPELKLSLTVLNNSFKEA